MNKNYGANKTQTLASLPIAGRYRVVDFVLSNMTNSELKQ